jgi:hypothetical protein
VRVANAERNDRIGIQARSATSSINSADCPGALVRTAWVSCGLRSTFEAGRLVQSGHPLAMFEEGRKALLCGHSSHVRKQFALRGLGKPGLHESM